MHSYLISRMAHWNERVFMYLSFIKYLRQPFINIKSTIPSKQNICITFVQRRPNVFDVGPALFKCYTNVLCLLGIDDNIIRDRKTFQVNTGHSPNAASMLAHRLQRWPNIEMALCPVFAGLRDTCTEQVYFFIYRANTFCISSLLS